jgi:hypothetical protein
MYDSGKRNRPANSGYEWLKPVRMQYLQGIGVRMSAAATASSTSTFAYARVRVTVCTVVGIQVERLEGPSVPSGSSQRCVGLSG